MHNTFALSVFLLRSRKEQLANILYMASIKPISATYSSTLDPMVHAIGRYLRSTPDPLNKKRTWKAVYDFCHNNTPQFRDRFVGKIEEPIGQVDDELGSNISVLFEDFVEYLISLPGECIFLLKDTHAVMRAYQQRTGKGYGILANRRFLCDNDEDRYFTLIQMLYFALEEAQEWDLFLDAYLEQFRHLIRRDACFAEKARQVFEYLSMQDLSEPVTWVDLGFQFTFVLFCYASVHVHSKGTIRQHLYCLTVYPWLHDRFHGHYFTDSSESVLAMELEGIRSFFDDRTDRFAGALLGFAIGDALGFPAAGIDRKDLSRFVRTPILEFVNNPWHPYFPSLQPGQFTDNTRLLLLSAEHVQKCHGFQSDAYVSKLIQWGESVLNDNQRQRWLGPTAAAALRLLITGADYRHSGSTTTQSCSATYRIIPFALVYSPFGAASQEELRDIVETVAMITHNSPISKAGALVVALLLSGLLSGFQPERALNYALSAVAWDAESQLLKSRIREAIHMYHKSSSDTHARKVLGTGSPIYQTLPLACFFFLKYYKDFAAAVTSAANSYRDDTSEERARLSHLSWDEQLIACMGGNTDGIAALTGAFMGAYSGQGAIPDEFAKVECGATIRNSAAHLAKLLPAKVLVPCR
jgi:ADP-ribosylglycohydrolase